jgi:hypothetical protein
MSELLSDGLRLSEALFERETERKMNANMRIARRLAALRPRLTPKSWGKPSPLRNCTNACELPAPMETITPLKRSRFENTFRPIISA